MSMPEFPKPDPDLTQEQALTLILSSIALEEAALSHIMNAEGEKIQHVLKQCPCSQTPDDQNYILAVNKSVVNVLEMVLQNQMILKNKMDKVLEYLPKPPYPPDPPCPPSPPCPPEPPCPLEPPCPSLGCCTFCQACFGVIPKRYCFGEPMRWRENNTWGRFSLSAGNDTKIQLPCSGMFMVGISMDICKITAPLVELELTISGQDKAPVVRKISLTPCQNTLYREFAVQMPRLCGPCHASIALRSPHEIDIRQGRIVFSKM